MAVPQNRQFILEMNRLLLGAEDNDNDISTKKNLNAKVSNLAELLLKAIEQDDNRKVQEILSTSYGTKVLFHCVTASQLLTTPLEYACKKASKRVASTILRFMPDKTKLGEVNHGYAPLHHAASSGNTDALQLIIDMEVIDINLKNPNIKTSLHLAASNGHEETVKVLIENSQIDIDPKDCTGETPLSLAAANGHLNIVCILLKKGANINNKSQYGFTPLLNAACKGRSHVVLELLKYGADANVCDTDKDTVLHFVSRDCPADLLRELLRGGALLGVSNKRGVTPLHGMSAKSLEKVLNDSVTTELIPDVERGIYVKDHKKIKFTNAFATTDQQTNSDLKNFLAISESKKHEYLVFHPLFKSLISMKWQVVQRLYFTKLALFLAFIVLLSLYIFLNQKPTSSNHLQQDSTSNVILYPSNESGYMHYKSDITHDVHNFTWLKIILYFFLVFFIGFRTLETVFRWNTNFYNLSHWSEILLLTITVAYFLDYQSFAVPVLLLAWIQTFLHVSRYPLVSPLYYIFCYISKSFLTFLLFSLVLMIGFLLSFHFLFRDCDNGEYCVGRAFITLPSSSLKLTAMMLGEIGYEQFPIEDKFNLWGPLLAVFIFFICFVLMNMMNGLAVSDTQDLRKRAEFSTIVAQGEMILSIESLINDLWWAPILSKVKFFNVPKISSFKILPSSGICLEALPDKCIKGKYLQLHLVDESNLLLEKRKRSQSSLNLVELKSYLDQLRLDIDRLMVAK